jgi:hypothetical protein
MKLMTLMFIKLLHQLSAWTMAFCLGMITVIALSDYGKYRNPSVDDLPMDGMAAMGPWIIALLGGLVVYITTHDGHSRSEEKILSH